MNDDSAKVRWPRQEMQRNCSWVDKGREKVEEKNPD